MKKAIYIFLIILAVILLFGTFNSSPIGGENHSNSNGGNSVSDITNEDDATEETTEDIFIAGDPDDGILVPETEEVTSNDYIAGGLCPVHGYVTLPCAHCSCPNNTSNNVHIFSSGYTVVSCKLYRENLYSVERLYVCDLCGWREIQVLLDDCAQLPTCNH